MDLASFIESHRRAFLVTRAAGGGPTAHPMTLIPHSGTIYFNTYRKSAKVRNLERDPRMSCVAASKDGTESVAVRGRAHVVAADDLPAALLAGGSGGAVMSEEDMARVRARLASGKRVYVRVEPDEVAAGAGLAPPGLAGAGLAPPGLAGTADAVPAWKATVQASPIAMSAGEVDAFLRSNDVAALATLDAGGWPRVTLARYSGGAGTLLAWAPHGAAWEGPACLTVDEFPTYETIRGVMAHGRGKLAAGAPGGFVAVRVVPERVVSFDFRKIGSGSGR